MMTHFVYQSLSFLDDVPDKIYQRLITHGYRANKQSSLKSRCYGVIGLSHKLFSGDRITLDELNQWLLKDHADQVYRSLNDNEVQDLARGNQSFTDDVILNLLDWLDDTESKSILNHHPYSVAESLGDSGECEALQDNEYSDSFNYEKPPYNSNLSLVANDKMSEAMQGIHQSFGFERQLGWDLSRGIKQDTDIRMILKLHATIKSSSYLRSIINLIGRKKTDRHDVIHQEGLNILRQVETGKANTFPDEHSVDSVSGVFRGDDISRMLPSQLVMLGHPGLKLLWHARRAEHQLLSYHIRGVLSEHIPDIQPVSLDNEQPGRLHIQKQGPMLVCLDTSASMKGRSEYLAKAVALECMRVARKTGRDCFLINFSGEGEIEEMKIDIPATGWKPVLDFINSSFHGGTDIDGVLLHALSCLKLSSWRDADLLLVSDGRFSLAERDTFSNEIKALPNVRLFGIQVSRWSNSEFGDICYRVFNLAHVQ